jgi:cell division septum initiation protein DivIVA
MGAGSDQKGDDPVVSPIEFVLAAERSAEEFLTAKRREAAQIVDAARAEAQRIEQRTDARIEQIRTLHTSRTTDLVEQISSSAAAGTESPPRISQEDLDLVAVASREFAGELVGLD